MPLASDDQATALDWTELAVQVDGEAAEAVCELIHRYLPGGAVIELSPAAPDTVTVKAFLPPDAHETRTKIEQGLWHLGQIYPIPEPCFRTLVYREWAEAWKEQFGVLRVGRRVVIKPSWLSHEPAADDVVVEIDPGMAFGTGLHPSTRLCLQALETLVQPGTRLLDLGTGSGILAIAAARLGAGRVVALDVDELAVRATTANAAANGVAHRLQVAQGSIEQLAANPEPFAGMLVNITVDVILSLLERGLLAHLSPGGWFVASGMLEDQAGQVLAVLGENGLTALQIRQEKDWVAVVGHKA